MGLEAINSPGEALGAIWALYNEQQKKFTNLPKLARVAREMDFPLIGILARMEHGGIRLDAQVLNAMNTKLTREITSLQTQIYAAAGYEFNVSSEDPKNP